MPHRDDVRGPQSEAERIDEEVESRQIPQHTRGDEGFQQRFVLSDEGGLAQSVSCGTVPPTELPER